MYPLKIKISSCIAFKNCEVVYGPETYPWKLSKLLVHRWTSANIFKCISFQKITIKWCFKVDRCFAYTLTCQECILSNISLISPAVYLLDWAANRSLMLGLIEQHTSSCVSLQREGWLVGWAKKSNFFHQVWNFTNDWWILLKQYKNWIMPNFQLNLTFFRRCTPRLKIVLFITFFTYFSPNYS